jgi:hypothetical protein
MAVGYTSPEEIIEEEDERNCNCGVFVRFQTGLQSGGMEDIMAWAEFANGFDPLSFATF